MRLLLGGLLLVVLFLAATVWQRSWTSAARSERSVARGGPSAVASDLPEGWSRVVIGRPSGAEPFRGPSPSGPSAGPGSDSAIRGLPLPPLTPQLQGTKSSDPRTLVTAVVVQPGQDLSTICREHYGTARVEVVQAVSRHNHLASPDTVREGQKLELPSLDQLLPKR